MRHQLVASAGKLRIIRTEHLVSLLLNARQELTPDEPPDLPPGVELPPRPQLPEGTADTPLVRVFKVLRK